MTKCFISTGCSLQAIYLSSKWKCVDENMPWVHASNLTRTRNNTKSTHWGRDKMAATLADDTFKCKFVNENILISIKKIHWSLFLMVQLTICQHWFRLWLGAVQATNHFLNQWCYNLPTHLCVTRPQWVKITQFLYPYHKVYVFGNPQCFIKHLHSIMLLTKTNSGF